LTQKGLLPYGGKHFWLNTSWKEKQKDIKIIRNLIDLRDPKKYKELKTLLSFDPHPLFDLIDGDIEDWEIITPRN